MTPLARAARKGALGALTLACAVWPAACRKPPSVSLDVVLPSSLKDQTKWVEIGAFPNAPCSAVGPMLAGGVPPEGAAARLAFGVGQRTPALGDIPKARYAFASTARDENCGIVAIGCSDVDVSTQTSVSIALQPFDGGATACPGGAQCVEARCVAGTDNGDPALGSDCSLAYVGSGPLGDPLLASGGLVSAPSIAVTQTGFLLAYREYDPFAGQARASFIIVDNGGGATAGSATTLPDRCTTGEESDAVGMSFSDDHTGLFVVSRAPCGSKPAGIDLLDIDNTGAVAQSGFEGKDQLRRLLSPAHALTYDPNAQDFILAFTQQKDAQIVFATGNRLQQTAAISFGGQGSKTGAWVAATSQVRAFLAAGAGGTNPGPPPNDAGGGDGASEGGVVDASPPPTDAGGTSASTLRLQLLAPQDDPAMLTTMPPTDSFTGTWGSIAATGARVIVATDGSSGGKQIAYRVYEGGGPPKASDGIVLEGAGKVAYADTAINQDHVFFAIEKASPPTGSTVALYAYANATTTPTFKRRVVLSSDPRIPSMAGVRDGQIAVAASDTRVAVMWTTGKTLTDKDAVGGYAVFACSTP